MLGLLTNLETEDILRTNYVGRVGCNDGEKTYIVPISYKYENKVLFCHSRDGLKIEMMRRNPKVCFEIDEINDYTHWRSVIAWGIYEEVTDENEVELMKNKLSEFLLIFKTSETSASPENQQERFHTDKPDYAPSIYYKIHLTEVTGRFEKAL